MQVTIVGAHHGESSRCHFPSVLVDRVLALDAGSITSSLSLEDQEEIKHILLTHHHYDHMKDLATIGFNRMGRGQINIYCSPRARAAAEATILNAEIWLNFFAIPTAEKPTFVHVPVEPNQPFNLEGYRVRPVPLKHSIPALGYEITSSSGGTLLYTGDCGPGSGIAWASTNPDLLITEVTYPDADAGLAEQFGHLSPRLLAKELRDFRDARGTLPRVAILHVDPYHEAQIATEVAAVARSLSADIWLPAEGSTIVVG